MRSSPGDTRATSLLCDSVSVFIPPTPLDQRPLMARVLALKAELALTVRPHGGPEQRGLPAGRCTVSSCSLGSSASRPWGRIDHFPGAKGGAADQWPPSPALAHQSSEPSPWDTHCTGPWRPGGWGPCTPTCGFHQGAGLHASGCGKTVKASASNSRQFWGRRAGEAEGTAAAGQACGRLLVHGWCPLSWRASAALPHCPH